MSLNTQLTTTSALSLEMQTFYDRQLLENMKPNLVHTEFGQKRSYSRRNGKVIDFRKFTPFSAITTALSEGVVPDGQNLAMTDVSATVAEYGGYVALSDLLDLTAIDPVVTETNKLMAQQAAESVDTIVREVLHAGTNKLIGNSKTARYQLVAGDKLSTTEIRKAVRSLKKANAKPFPDGYFVAIVGPDTTYDLQSDTTWQDVSKYQNATQIYAGEIGRIFGVRFVETSVAKTLSAADLSVANRNLTVAASTGYVANTKTLTITQTLTSADQAALVGRKILITSSASGAAIEQDTVASATATTLVLTTGLSDATVADYNSQTVYPGSAGAAGVTLGSTLVLGQNAYGVVDIENGAAPQLIVKPAGSAGTADPLNQFSTIGWKVPAFATVILQQLFMIRIEHGISA